LLKGVHDVIVAEPSWRDAKDRRFIRIEVDITKPNEASIAEVQRRIDLGRSLYEAHAGPLPDHRKKPRLRLDQYGNYLKVWELRIERKTFEQIAREVFPREMDGPIESGGKEGTEPLQTRSLLGHSSSEVTRETYIHLVPADARRAVEGVESLLEIRGKSIGPKCAQVPDWPELGSMLIN
jgi:hypothetical protein